jgi:hypothetical protein
MRRAAEGGKFKRLHRRRFGLLNERKAASIIGPNETRGGAGADTRALLGGRR